MPPEVLPQYHYNDINLLIKSLTMILGNLDRFHENENFEILSQIEMEIEKLPLDKSVKSALCNILWAPNLSIETSLSAIVKLLSNPSYINYKGAV